MILARPRHAPNLNEDTVLFETEWENLSIILCGNSKESDDLKGIPTTINLVTDTTIERYNDTDFTTDCGSSLECETLDLIINTSSGTMLCS